MRRTRRARRRRRRRRSARFPSDSETTLGGTLAGSHTRHGFSQPRLADSETPEDRAINALGTPQGRFLMPSSLCKCI